MHYAKFFVALFYILLWDAGTSYACQVYGPDGNKVDTRRIKPEIRWVVFDVGGVLAYDLVEPVRRYLAHRYRNYIRSPDDLRSDRRKADLGEQTDAEYWKEALRKAGVPKKLVAIDKKWKCWKRVLAKLILGGSKKSLCNKQILDVARLVKRQGYHVAILSDDSYEMSQARRVACEFDKVFNDSVAGDGKGGIFISSEVAALYGHHPAYKKPQKGAYLHMLRDLRVNDASKVIFIDNKLKNLIPNRKKTSFSNSLMNQTGSSGFGMYSIHFEGQKKGKANNLPPGHPGNENKQDLIRCLKKVGVALAPR